MEQAKVYFTDFRCHPGLNQQQKLEKLLTAAGMGNIDFEGKIVAIKLHFGELGNLAYLRPNYAKTVADFIKARLQHTLCRQPEKRARAHGCGVYQRLLPILDGLPCDHRGRPSRR